MPSQAPQDAGPRHQAGVFQLSGAAVAVIVQDKTQCCRRCWLSASFVTSLNQCQVLSCAVMAARVLLLEPSPQLSHPCCLGGCPVGGKCLYPSAAGIAIDPGTTRTAVPCPAANTASVSQRRSAHQIAYPRGGDENPCGGCSPAGLSSAQGQDGHGCIWPSPGGPPGDFLQPRVSSHCYSPRVLELMVSDHLR